MKRRPKCSLRVARKAEYMFRRIGITFGVYGDKDAAERLIPFDIIPRLISRSEWARLEKGITQRVNALNMFLTDVYGRGAILKENLIPSELILRNPFYRPEMIGRRVPHDIWIHINGTDLVRVDGDQFYTVLEDNARTPSGVSYMMENREVTKLRLMPDLFAKHRVAPVEDYPDALLSCLRSVAPRAGSDDATIVLLTPGPFNSAYYEHSFLADKLGIELVEGPRSHHLRRYRLYAHDARPAACRCDLPQGRRRLHRSARLPIRIRCSACRP